MRATTTTRKEQQRQRQQEEEEEEETQLTRGADGKLYRRTVMALVLDPHTGLFLLGTPLGRDNVHFRKPVQGGARRGETLVDAARREMAEEIGIVLDDWMKLVGPVLPVGTSSECTPPNTTSTTTTSNVGGVERREHEVAEEQQRGTHNANDERHKATGGGNGGQHDDHDDESGEATDVTQKTISKERKSEKEEEEEKTEVFRDETFAAFRYPSKTWRKQGIAGQEVHPFLFLLNSDGHHKNVGGGGHVGAGESHNSNSISENTDTARAAKQKEETLPDSSPAGRALIARANFRGTADSKPEFRRLQWMPLESLFQHSPRSKHTASLRIARAAHALVFSALLGVAPQDTQPVTEAEAVPSATTATNEGEEVGTVGKGEHQRGETVEVSAATHAESEEASDAAGNNSSPENCPFPVVREALRSFPAAAALEPRLVARGGHGSKANGGDTNAGGYRYGGEVRDKCGDGSKNGAAKGERGEHAGQQHISIFSNTNNSDSHSHNNDNPHHTDITNMYSQHGNNSGGVDGVTSTVTVTAVNTPSSNNNNNNGVAFANNDDVSRGQHEMHQAREEQWLSNWRGSGGRWGKKRGGGGVRAHHSHRKQGGGSAYGTNSSYDQQHHHHYPQPYSEQRHYQHRQEQRQEQQEHGYQAYQPFYPQEQQQQQQQQQYQGYHYHDGQYRHQWANAHQQQANDRYGSSTSSQNVYQQYWDPQGQQ